MWDALLYRVCRNIYVMRTASFSPAHMASDKVDLHVSVGFFHLLYQSYSLDNLWQASKDSSSNLRQHSYILFNFVEIVEMIRVLFYITEQGKQSKIGTFVRCLHVILFHKKRGH